MAKIKKEMEESQKAQSAMERRSSELAAKVEKLSISLNESRQKAKSEASKMASRIKEAEEKSSGSKSVAAKGR